MKRIVSLILCVILTLSMLAGCGKPQKEENETPKVEDDGVMKILLIGHSTGVDSAYMLPAVAKNEGVENLVVGMLYHSGCRLAQHVEYLTGNAPQYAYYEFDVASGQEEWLRADKDGNFLVCEPTAPNDIYIDDGSIGQTMQFAIARHDWDIVVMQGNCVETANQKDGPYTPNLEADIKTIQDYVLANDIEKGTTPKFAWNMIWGMPTDRGVLRENDKTTLDTLFGGDAMNLRQGIADTARDIIKPEENFSWFMPSAAALWQAQKMGMTVQELHRDYVHGSDFTRMMVGYLWYCVLFDKNIDDCTLAPISSKLVFDALMHNTGKDLELTEEQKNVLRTCVKAAIQNPYDICK